MKTIGQLADHLAKLFDTEQEIAAIRKEQERPMLPAKRAELDAEADRLSAVRDTLRAEELLSTLHKP